MQKSYILIVNFWCIWPGKSYLYLTRKMFCMSNISCSCLGKTAWETVSTQWNLSKFATFPQISLQQANAMLTEIILQISSGKLVTATLCCTLHLRFHFHQRHPKLDCYAPHAKSSSHQLMSTTNCVKDSPLG